MLNGTLRLVLGEHDLRLTAGEAVEFDTRTPHWFGATTAGPVEYLSLVGRHGERAHIRATTERLPPGWVASVVPTGVTQTESTTPRHVTRGCTVSTS
nr:hypothetical protein GCM10025730_55490 [Promicromonospora thailandica]